MSSEAESNAARPSSASANKRSKSTTSYLTRSVTAFELHSHYSHRNIYPTFSSGYAIRQKYFPLRDHDLNERGLQRPKSSVNNLMKRSYTTALIRATSRKRLYDVSPKEELYEEELLNPKRSILTLMRIAMVYFGIEVLFSLETALAVPILLKLKVPESLYSFVYFLSPLFGFLFQPILGVMSDRCESRFGRRRPFILILSIGAFIGASLILNGYLIGDWLGDAKLKIPYIAIILVGTGVTFLDFCADSTDSPLRAFLLDVCNPEDQDTGLNIHAILGGSGAALGFILGAIDWNQTFLHHLGDELQVLYVFSSVIFFIGLVVTLTSAKEIPIVLIKNNKERMPLIESANNLLVLPEEVFEEKDDRDKKDEESNHEEEEEDEEDFDQPITLKTLLHSILKMPKELIRLIICQTFGWIAYFSLTLFMTDFCGQSIYHGDPSAPEDSELFKKYNDGVKMGCWCLLVYSVTTAFSALLLENFLMKRFSTRTLYFFYFFIYAICTGCMYFQTSIYVIMPLCASIGVLLTSLTTLPYQMLSDFHKDKNFRNQSAAGTKRGLGVDCSLLSSCYFLSQTFTSAFMSFLTAAFGNYVIVIVASLFSFAGCLWISLFVIFPRECNQQTSKSKSDADGSIIKA